MDPQANNGINLNPQWGQGFISISVSQLNGLTARSIALEQSQQREAASRISAVRDILEIHEIASNTIHSQANRIAQLEATHQREGQLLAAAETALTNQERKISEQAEQLRRAEEKSDQKDVEIARLIQERQHWERVIRSKEAELQMATGQYEWNLALEERVRVLESKLNQLPASE